ncbi:MAG: carbohydrate kinase family protein [Candidatus Peribacteraceae bacterium]|nr:carbohydrate kinase family protein [Candidatus Peribacteraceae bacterium]
MTSPKTPTQAPRTLSIGGATYDLFVRTGSDVLREDHGKKILELPLGEKVRVQQVIETCGGGAANTSVGLSRLGCAAHFCGILGSDQWGQRQLENLTKEKVDHRATTVVEGETSSFSIILSAGSGERVILYDPGTNAHLHDANFDREQAATMDWIYLNHLHERSCVIEDDIAAMLEKNEGMGITWNPGGSQLKTGMKETKMRHLLSQTDLLVFNKEESLLFTGETSVETAMASLLNAGVRIVCVCDGKNGSTASDGKTTWHCPVADAPVIDTTGAGDAFGTGATWALLQGLPLPDMLRAGTINAASVLGAIGAQAGLLTDTQIRQRLTTVRLDVMEN